MRTLATMPLLLLATTALAGPILDLAETGRNERIRFGATAREAAGAESNEDSFWGGYVTVSFGFTDGRLTEVRVASESLTGTENVFKDFFGLSAWALQAPSEPWTRSMDAAEADWKSTHFGAGILTLRARDIAPRAASAPPSTRSEPAQEEAEPALSLTDLFTKGRFGGANLGARINAIEGLRRRSGGAMSTYVRPGDEREIDGLIIDEVLYLAEDGRLSGIVLKVQGQAHSVDLAQALDERLGRADRADAATGQLVWRGAGITVTLRALPRTAEAMALVQRTEDAERAARESAARRQAATGTPLPDEGVAGLPCEQRPGPFTWDGKLGRCRASDGKFALDACCGR